MSRWEGRARDRSLRYVIGLLVVVNVVLIGLNMQKRDIVPFRGVLETFGDPPSGRDAARADELARVDEAADPGPEAGQASADDAGTAATGPRADDDALDLGVDDWPGGRGPVPDGDPVPRTALLSADGSVRLAGSVPSWAAATEIADVVGSRLPGGPDAVAVELTWHPAAPAGAAGAIVLDPPITYEAGQVAVPPAAGPVLDTVAGLLAQRPAAFVVVVGHIDDLGESEENVAVALARAAAVVTELEARGVDPARTVAVVAAEDPLAPPNDTADDRAFNRRVEVRVENVLGPEAGG